MNLQSLKTPPGPGDSCTQQKLYKSHFFSLIQKCFFPTTTSTKIKPRFRITTPPRLTGEGGCGWLPGRAGPSWVPLIPPGSSSRSSPGQRTAQSRKHSAGNLRSAAAGNGRGRRKRLLVLQQLCTVHQTRRSRDPRLAKKYLDNVVKQIATACIRMSHACNSQTHKPPRPITLLQTAAAVPTLSKTRLPRFLPPCWWVRVISFI